MATFQYPPGPTTRSPFGVVKTFRADPLGFLVRMHHEYGDIVHYRLGPVHMVQVNNPEYVQEILVTQGDKFQKSTLDQRIFQQTSGNSLLSLEGEAHRKERKLMQPVFHSKRIDGFAHTMLDYTTQMINGWKNDQSVDIKHEMTRLTMLIVGKTLFDADLSGAGAEIAEAMHFMSDDSNSQYQQGFIIPKWIPAPQNLRLEKARKRLDELLLPVIEARRQSGEDRGDLLSMLLSSQDAESGHKLSNQSIRDEVVALFIAGHETTANTLSWTLYLLATHLEIEAKVRAELSQVIGSRPPTVADLRNLPYLDWVIKESMRLYPPAWVLFGRSPIEPMKVGDYLLPTHVRLFLPPYTIHRSAKYYTHPEDFQPERWANDFEKTLPKYAYFPFGGGAHVCIGNSFALMEAKLILASILPRFQFTYLDSQPPEKHPLITLQPKEGLVMRVNVRETVMV